MATPERSEQNAGVDEEMIADTGIDAWQAPARDALAQHLAANR